MLDHPLLLMLVIFSAGFLFGLGFGTAMWLINALVATWGR